MMVLKKQADNDKDYPTPRKYKAKRKLDPSLRPCTERLALSTRLLMATLQHATAELRTFLAPFRLGQLLGDPLDARRTSYRLRDTPISDTSGQMATYAN